MNAFEILVSTSALLAVPVIADRFSIQARHAALATIWAVALAAAVIISALAMCAMALTGLSGSGNGGFSAKHLFPSLPFTGWISFAMISLALVSGVRALLATSSRRRSLAEHLRFAPITHVDQIAVATLPVEEFVAAAIPGPEGYVVVSEGAMDRLTALELRAVVHHEEAHRRLGHHRYLLLARTADRSLWFIPGMRNATKTLRGQLEVAADADACKWVPSLHLKGALHCGAPCPDRATARRLERLGRTSNRRSEIAGLVLCLGLVSSITVFFELSWLGVVA